MFNRLEERGNEYHITSKRIFNRNGELSDQDIEKCYDFAYGMTFGTEGEHRNHRSGGQTRRKNGEIFIDTFQGKLAEFAFYNYFKNRGKSISEPDLSKMGLNEWDGCDFLLNNKQVAIKSTKHFGNLLLLETKDWTDDGQYIPNSGTNHTNYDYFVMIRIRPDGTSIMTRNRWLYSNEVGYESLKEQIMKEDWECNIAGFVTHDELVGIIQAKHILPQNMMLNGTTRMDAENYYIQLGDMHEIAELVNN